MHPLVLAAQQIFVAQPEREAWANTMAEQAERLLVIARQLAPDTTDEDYEAALRAAARAVILGEREYPSLASLRWKEAALHELSVLDVQRFGFTRTVNPGYTPLHGPSLDTRPRGPLLGRSI